MGTLLTCQHRPQKARCYSMWSGAGFFYINIFQIPSTYSYPKPNPSRGGDGKPRVRFGQPGCLSLRREHPAFLLKQDAGDPYHVERSLERRCEQAQSLGSQSPPDENGRPRVATSFSLCGYGLEGLMSWTQKIKFGSEIGPSSKWANIARREEKAISNNDLKMHQHHRQ
jgi:hypothetical protein